MSVTVDHEPLAAEALGLQTVGEVLAHVQRDNRLVVQLLIDGEEPDLSSLVELRRRPLLDRTIYIETADAAQMALQTLASVSEQLQEADEARTQAADLLREDKPAAALQALAVCFRTWHNAQESVAKIAQLLAIDLQLLQLTDQSLADTLLGFAEQLRRIKTALENRDWVDLTDILVYEATQTSQRWDEVLTALRQTIRPA